MENDPKGPSLYDQFTKLGRESSAYLLGSAANRLIAIALIPMYTRYLTPHDYGVFAVVIATVSFMSVIMKLGMPAAFVRFYLDTDEENLRKEVLSTSFFFVIMWAFLFLVILIPISGLLGRSLLQDQNLSILFIFAFTAALLDSNSAILLSRFRAKGKSKRYVIFTLSRFTIGVILNIVFVAFLGRGIRGIFEAGLISALILFGSLIPIASKELLLQVKLDTLKRMLRYGVPLVPANLALIAIFFSDRLFLQFFRGAADVGLYNLGYNIGLAVNVILVGPFSLAWGPLAFTAYRNKKSAIRLYSRALTYYVCVGSFLCLIFSLLAKPAVVFLTTPSFYEASKVVPIIAVSYFFSGLMIVLGTGIRLEKKTNYIAYTYISAAVLNLILNYFLVPRIGMIGAAITSLVSYVFIAVVIHHISRNLVKVKYETRRLGKIVVATAATGLLGLGYQSSSIVSEAIGKTIILLVFPAVLLLTSFFTFDEKKQIKKILSSRFRFFKLS